VQQGDSSPKEPGSRPHQTAQQGTRIKCTKGNSQEEGENGTLLKVRGVRKVEGSFTELQGSLGGRGGQRENVLRVFFHKNGTDKGGEKEMR